MKTMQLPTNSNNKIIENLNISGYQKLDASFVHQIEQNSQILDPIIQILFNRLIEICLNDFDFLSNDINYDAYHDFYKEINRITRKHTKKIIQVRCNQVAYFVGDLHGAIHEAFLLVNFFTQIIKIRPDVKIIFVGDYVDRNKYDLETLTLIVAFKMLFSENVILLRGNHETREINEAYGFFNNLQREFHEKGERLYDLIIQYFMKLPLINILRFKSQIIKNRDIKVMTVHGGIPINPENPYEPIDIDTLEEKLKSEKQVTNAMDPISVSILWGDPDEMVNGIETGTHLQGRARFGRQIYEIFKQKNQIDLVVRGHQTWKDGFRKFFDSLYSIFSTSTYDDYPKFNPKILRLEIDKAPKILEVTENALNHQLELVN
jgi:predicted phosphodiesterase